MYDPQAADNEEKSAALAQEVLPALGAKSHLVDRVTAAILAIKQHGHTQDVVTSILLDLDLRILGAPRWKYNAYAHTIRTEYAHVPEDAYRTGRAAVLNAFLARPAIYQTPQYRKAREAKTRRNMEAELRRLA